jgi:acetyl esterase/lipase
VQGFITLSTPFDVAGLQHHFRTRGMSEELLHGIFAPEPPTPGRQALYSYRLVSPFEICGCAAGEACPPMPLPSTLLLHGAKDATVPVSESIRMCEALRQRGVDAVCKVYPEGTHTSIFVEGPFAGGRDVVLEDVLQFVLSESGIPEDEAYPGSGRSWPLIPFPRLLRAVASAVCPF